ncbi:MAG: universal stress protein [Phaeodactylibacter sp.]|uniref:universal stress protein n=1 Tax=Phaeodactylibacter sp. TaxID=1940289 RepID=UPI0032EDB1C0
MHRLLVATDFSPAARNAFEYALHLAAHLQAEVHLVFINKTAQAETTLPERYHRALIAQDNRDHEKKLQRWATHYPDQKAGTAANTPLHYHVYDGNVAPAIIRAAKEVEADVIVLGGRNKHNIREHLFGSVTTHLTGQSPCPLLIIPEKATYQPLQSIAFAIDITLDEQRVLKQLREMAIPLGAEVQPFFVNMLPEEQDKIKLEQLDDDGQRIDMVRDQEVTSGIAYYLEHHPVQMLAMYIPKRAFHEHLLHGHLLRYMAWHTPLPLLLVRE